MTPSSRQHEFRQAAPTTLTPPAMNNLIRSAGFEASNSWLADYHWAAQDPSRVKTASELSPSHHWDIVDTLSRQERQDMKDFQDAMYEALTKVHTTSNGSKLRIKVPKDIVDNISNCFARARVLQPDLARRTESFFLEWPNHLLTVAVPTDFDLKDAWAKQGNSKLNTPFTTKRTGQTSPRSSRSASSALRIEPKTAKECPNSIPVMAPLGWFVRSTIHYSSTPPTSVSQIRKGYPVRPCETPPMPHWKPDVDFHDTGKANGIDFPATVRSSKFSQYKEIEGMDPLQISLWKFLYQGLNNTWLRRIAHGRDVFILPFDNIGTTVFIAELSQQLKARNLDLDRLAAYRSRQNGVHFQQKEATQFMAKEVAQLMQSWLPSPTAPDPTSQQRILDLEAQLAALKGQQSTDSPAACPAPSGSTPTAPILQSLQGQQPSAPTFSPQSLLVMPGSPNQWLEANPIPSLSETAYKKWLRDLQLPQPKKDVLDRNLSKALEWWSQQPDSAGDQIQRVLVVMEMHPSKLTKNTNLELMVRVMTVALTCSE